MSKIFLNSRITLRSIQLFLSILAFSTTSKFNTTTTLVLKCIHTSASRGFEYKINYPVKYPFKFTDQTFEVYQNCTSDHKYVQSFDIDFSYMARFYVSIGEFSMFYTIVFLIIYIFGSNYYKRSGVLPILDFAFSGILGVFWFCGTFSWNQTQADLQYYTNSQTLLDLIAFCKSEDKTRLCFEQTSVDWLPINISLAFGYINVLFWFIIMWFIYKETHFYPNTKNDNQENNNRFITNVKQQIPSQDIFDYSEKKVVSRY